MYRNQNSNSTFNQQSLHRTSSLSQIPRLSNFGLGGMHGSQLHFASNSNGLDESTLGMGYRNPRLMGENTMVDGTPLHRRLNEAVSDFSQGSQMSQPGRATNSMGRPFGDRVSSNVFAQIGVAPLVDPRQLDTPANRVGLINDLVEFCASEKFAKGKYVLTAEHLKMTKGPSLQQFCDMFEFIMSALLGRYTKLDDADPKNRVKVLDDQVRIWASQLEYPYTNALKKSIWQTISAKSSWPIAMGFLDWLREEAQMWIDKTQDPWSNFASADAVEVDPTLVFREMRIKFLVEFYRRKKNREATDDEFKTMLAEFGEDLRQRVNHKDTVAQSEQKVAELRQTLEDFKANHVPLDELRARLAHLQSETAKEIGATENLKIILTQVENKMIADQHAEKTLLSENRVLQQECDALEAIIKRQPMKAQVFRQKQRDASDLRQKAQSKQGETRDYVAKIEAQQIKKSEAMEKLRRIIQELRSLIAELSVDPARSVLPDYSEETELKTYIALVRGEVDRVVRELAERVNRNETEKQLHEKRLKDLTNKSAQLAAKEEQLLMDEKKLGAGMSEMEAQKKQLESAPSVAADKLEIERQKLVEARAGRDKLKADVRDIETKLEKKVGGWAKLKRRTAESQNAAAIIFGRFKEASQKQLDMLDEQSKNLDAALKEAKEAVEKTKSVVVKGLRGSGSGPGA